jgi:hypothetical protein
MFNRWTPTNTNTNIPALGYQMQAQTINNGNYVDFYLTDASYFNLRNITLGYTLPKSWMKAAKLGNVRVFASADNIALFTHLKGMDPQYNFSGSTDYAYSPNKTYSLGIEVNF